MTYMLKDDRRNIPRQKQADIVDVRFRKLLGARAWESLPVAVRKRFSQHITGVGVCIYRGKLLHTRMNRAGRFLAKALRVIGAPLPVECDEGGAPAVVTVMEDAAGKGQFWSRQYGRDNGRFPQIIQSTKRFSGPTGLEEYIGYGIGMTLRLEVKDGALLFHCGRYFLTLFGKRVYLPKFLKPGQLTVGHEDKGGGKFHFTLSLRHPLFGQLLDQCAEFTDPPKTQNAEA